MVDFIPSGFDAFQNCVHVCTAAHEDSAVDGMDAVQSHGSIVPSIVDVLDAAQVGPGMEAEHSAGRDMASIAALRSQLDQARQEIEKGRREIEKGRQENVMLCRLMSLTNSSVTPYGACKVGL